MKTIILKGRKEEVWLHLNTIQQIQCYQGTVFTETNIYCSDGVLIKMHDHTQQLHFRDLINRFAESDKCIKTLKVADLKIEKKYAFMRAIDWVTQAMKG